MNITLTHFQRTVLVITGGCIVAIGCLQGIPLMLIGASIGGNCLLLGMLSHSETPYEPPFGKIWFHEGRIKVRQEDIKLNEKAVAECRLEIERRQSRIAELEREKHGH